MPNMNGDFDIGWDDDIWLSDFENDLLDEELDDIDDDLYIQEFLSRRREVGL